MAIRIVRLGTPRAPDEGLRLGTVRRPPRGVPKAQLAARDFYDVWMPEAAPSEALLKAARQSIDDAAEVACWICSQHCRIAPTSRSGAIARTKLAVIDRFFGRSSRSAEPS